MTEIIQTVLTITHVIACVFLMLVVLIQPGKSGGLGAFGGASAQQVFGGRGAGNFLTKTTWATATIFFATSMTLAYLSSSDDDSLRSQPVAQENDTASRKPVPPGVPSGAPASK